MANIYDIQKRVALVAKNAPDFIIEESIFEAVQQLCIEAEVWQVMTDIDTTAGDAEISVSPPAGANIVRVMWATLADRVLTAMSDMEYAYSRTTPVHSAPRFYYQESPTLLQAMPIPILNEVGQARIVCALKAGSNKIPDDIFALYREHLANGALARVLSTPAEFGDQRLAAGYEQKWYAGLAQAKGRATRSKDNKAIIATYGGY